MVRIGGDTMNCLRCGKELESEHNFCDECVAEMEQHPVKPGTPIQLPNRDTRKIPKRTNFRLAESKWQDKIFRLKTTIVFLCILIVLLLAALVLCVGMLLQVTPAWINELFFENPAVSSIIQSGGQ